MNLPALFQRKELLYTRRDGSPALRRDGWRLHPREPRPRLHPRRHVRRFPWRRSGGRCFRHRPAPAEHVPLALRRGRVQRCLRSTVRRHDRRRRPRRRQSLRRGCARGPARRVAALRAAGRGDDAVVSSAHRAGFRRRAREIRPDGRADADHLSLSSLHLAGLAAGRHPQLGRSFRGAGGDADPPQPFPDRRLRAVGVLAGADRGGPGLGDRPRRLRAIPLADLLLRPCRHGAVAAAAAPDPGGAPPAAGDGAGGVRRGGDADQSPGLDRDRLAAADRRRLLPLLCRPADPVAAGRRRHRCRARSAPAMPLPRRRHKIVASSSRCS
jgi:hypothetical protein